MLLSILLRGLHATAMQKSIVIIILKPAIIHERKLLVPRLDLGRCVCVWSYSYLVTANDVSELEYETTTVSKRNADNVHKKCETVGAAIACALYVRVIGALEKKKKKVRGS